MYQEFHSVRHNKYISYKVIHAKNSFIFDRRVLTDTKLILYQIESVYCL